MTYIMSDGIVVRPMNANALPFLLSAIHITPVGLFGPGHNV